MVRKVRVAILFGGRSAEHDVSMASARNVTAALDRKKYEVVLIGIDRSGHWLPESASRPMPEKHLPREKSEKTLAILPGESGSFAGNSKIDVVFPMLHGPLGEDGTMQGLLRLADVPFVGADVLGSAVGMDKDVMKRLLRDAGIPIAKFLVMHTGAKMSYADAKKKLGTPMFVKPANLGSSVGVAKIRTEKEFKKAVANAFRFDTKILVEEFIDGREIECAVLGNDKPIASVPGEVIVHHDFYSYEAKYLDEHGASLAIPAKLPKKVGKRVQELAVATFKTLGCEGMGRVDCFVTKNGRVLVNEINTIPGFTNISMYPKLWEYSGIPYGKLIDELIRLAIERHARQKRLQTAR